MNADAPLVNAVLVVSRDGRRFVLEHRDEASPLNVLAQSEIARIQVLRPYRPDDPELKAVLQLFYAGAPLPIGGGVA